MDRERSSILSQVAGEFYRRQQKETPRMDDEISRLRSGEQRLRERFQVAEIVDPVRGYIDVGFVNGEVDPYLLQSAGKIVAHAIDTIGIRADAVIGIPDAGDDFATTLSFEMQIPKVSSRKGANYPKSWKDPIVVEDVPSFTRGGNSTFTFRSMNEGSIVILADDVIATGRTLLPTVAALRSRGIIPVVATYWAKEFRGTDPATDEEMPLGIDELDRANIPWFTAVLVENIEENRVVLGPSQLRE